jgi:asparagine synthase (glutamine-hydrolysing)
MQHLSEQNVPNRNDMDTITRIECSNYLLNTLLRDADALSMGHGLEVRPILLDHRLVEFALALPDSSKWRENRSKAILKDACDDLLPKGFFERKKKGFTLPTTSWLQNEMRERLHVSFDSEIARNLFSKDYLEKIMPQDLFQNRGLAAWMGLVLIEWLRQSGLEFE